MEESGLFVKPTPYLSMKDLMIPENRISKNGLKIKPEELTKVLRKSKNHSLLDNFKRQGPFRILINQFPHEVQIHYQLIEKRFADQKSGFDRGYNIGFNQGYQESKQNFANIKEIIPPQNPRKQLFQTREEYDFTQRQSSIH